jgi:hypothetical protein
MRKYLKSYTPQREVGWFGHFALADLPPRSERIETMTTATKALSPEQQLVRTCLAGYNYGLQLVRKRFSGNLDPDHDLAFHSDPEKGEFGHTQGVKDRAMLLAYTMGATPRELGRLMIVVGFHDAKMLWDDEQQADGSVLRKRPYGFNEDASAAEAKAWMRRQNGTFTEEDLKLVGLGITDGTKAPWDPEYGTVKQPGLVDGVCMEPLCAGLADIGIPGMDGGRVYVVTGDALYREEKMDASRTFRSRSKRRALTVEQWAWHKSRLIAWAKGQCTYAKGRRKRFLAVELSLVPAPYRAAVNALFCKFDETIDYAEATMVRREKMEPDELVDDCGFKVTED